MSLIEDHVKHLIYRVANIQSMSQVLSTEIIFDLNFDYSITICLMFIHKVINEC